MMNAKDEEVHDSGAMSEIKAHFKKQQQRSLILRNENLTARIQKLKRLREWIKTHRHGIQHALYQDFRKPPFETDTSEILVVLQEIQHTIRHLRQWAEARKVPTPATLPGTSSYIQYEPKGVCLIMAPWNYPFQLLVGPWISAIAAGNCAILKPSEMTPHTAALMAHMVTALFDPAEAAVFQGGKDVAQALLQQPFDHIFFTGSPAVGKRVMEAAARHLSSITLELGGKSPAIVDKTANLKIAAEKIVWGKFFNGGQTCVAPDYVLVHQEVHDMLIELLQRQVKKYYHAAGNTAQSSSDLARIVNAQHFQRLAAMLQQGKEKGAQVISGGDLVAEDLYIAPAILTSVPEETALMQEEIFGPLLPVKAVRSLAEAVAYVNQKPKPLSLYLFSGDKSDQAYVLKNTSSGSACVNDCMLQFAHPNLPFGGINHSGLGKSHGYYGFLAFSNEKSVLRQQLGSRITRVLYPPYPARVTKMVKHVMHWFF